MHHASTGAYETEELETLADQEIFDYVESYDELRGQDGLSTPFE